MDRFFPKGGTYIRGGGPNLDAELCNLWDRLGLEGPSALEAVLDDLKSRVRRVYVHLDLDVLDPEKAGRANEFAPEGGLGAEDLKMALGLVQERFAIAAAGIASYDPAFDADGRVLAVALACVQMLTGPEKPAV